MSDPKKASKAYWTAVQEALKKHGFDPGDINGKRGSQTDGALLKFKASRGLVYRPYIGPITESKLWAPARAVPSSRPRWLDVAYKYLGLRQIPGARHDPQILSWWEDIGAGWYDDDETPWCGAFVGGTLHESGIAILRGSKAPRARAWEKWGKNLPGPAVGAVVTFYRNGRSSGDGHVAFVAGRRGKKLVVLGGNQSLPGTKGAVTLDARSTKALTSYRWPSSEALPPTGKIKDLPKLD